MPTDSQYRNALRDELGRQGEGSSWNIYFNADVERVENGAWVQVWMFVHNDDLED